MVLHPFASIDSKNGALSVCNAVVMVAGQAEGFGVAVHTTGMTARPTESASPPLLVACLCAQWCGICRDYAPLLAATLARFGAGQLTVKWLDIEDHSDVLGDLDVQSFPTLLIARGDVALFFGPITPHAQTLQRLVQNALAGDMATLPADEDVRGLVANLQAFQAPPT
jgi:thioredoxin 1